MKSILHFSLLFFCSVIFNVTVAYSQSPQAFKYQAVVRNSAGLITPNQNVNLRISLLQNSATGTQVYSEEHAVTTNTFGLVNLEIGNGTNAIGIFTSINWSTGIYFIKLELDITGGTTFSDMGTTQLLSVPYALFAASGNPGPQGPQGQQGIQGLQGNAGIDGTDGINGTNGYSVLNGTSNPVTQGVDGDFYINTSTATLFGPKTSGVWGAGTSLIGPAGTYVSGTGINISGGAITNTAPDQTIILNNGTGITITGTYPNFTISNSAANQTQTLDQTLAYGNNAGTYDINMNNKSLTNVQTMAMANNYNSYIDMYYGKIKDYNSNFGTSGQILTSRGTDPNNYVLWENPAWSFFGNNIYNNSTFVGIGTTNPTTALHVNGTFRITDDSEGLNKVLTSDALGNASWQTPAIGSVNGTTNYIPKFTGTSSLGNSLFYENGNNIGLGSTTPSGRFMIQQDLNALDNEPIFEVKDKTGQTVMVIYKDSAHFFVKDPGGAKTENRGSFAVSGKSSTKAFTNNYLLVNPDNTHIYTTDTVSGFSVGNILSGTATDYLRLTPLNYFIGHECGINIQLDSLNPGMGQHNTFIGYQAGRSAVGAYQNTYIGYQTGINTVNGAWNIFIGQQAGFSNTSGLSNIFIGQESGYNMTNGVNNMCIGKEAGWAATTNVFGNMYIGNGAGRSNVSGNSNILIGVSAGYNNVSGEDNTFIGALTGFSNTGSDNVFVGSSSGIYTGSGRKNVYIGSYVANRSLGVGNVFIGYKANNTNFTSNSYNNSIAIGDSVICTASNQVRLGNSSIGTFYCQGVYAATTASASNVFVSSTGQVLRSTSSKRYKKDIEDLNISSEKIYQLRPVSYKSISDNSGHFGLIAEEVAKLIPELAEFALEKDVIIGSKSERLIPDAVQYPLLSVLLLKEVQNHQKKITLLTKENETLKSEIDILKKENSEQKTKNIEIDKLKTEIENIKSLIGTTHK